MNKKDTRLKQTILNTMVGSGFQHYCDGPLTSHMAILYGLMKVGEIDTWYFKFADDGTGWCRQSHGSSCMQQVTVSRRGAVKWKRLDDVRQGCVIKPCDEVCEPIIA